MPASYFGQEWENLDQIKFLIAARRFYYTSTAVILDSMYLNQAQSNINKFQLEKIDLPRFAEYAEGCYFPPL